MCKSAKDVSSQLMSGDHPAGIAPSELDSAIGNAMRALLAHQKPDGHFVFELEADATIPAEYVLLTHWRGESADLVLERKIANYLRRIQGCTAVGRCSTTVVLTYRQASKHT